MQEHLPLDAALLIDASLASVFLDRTEEGICAGIAVFERFGSRGWSYEIPADRSHPYSAIDKILHLLFVGGGRDLILHASSPQLYEEVAVHFKPYRVLAVLKRFTPDEQNRLFQETFALNSLLTPLEHLSLEGRPLSAQALAQLASALETSPLCPLALPDILSPEGLLELGNNALEQLEIITADPNAPALHRMVLALQTPMGERLARFRLFMPIRDPRELNRRYDWIDAVSPHRDYLATQLREIGDMENRWREALSGDGAPFRRSLLRLEEMMAYGHKHRLPIVREWTEEFAEWEAELSRRLGEAAWLHKQSGRVGKLLDYIARIDIAVSSARIAVRHALCRPVIVEVGPDENFLQIMKLRHLLVEEQGVSYVSNDIVMGVRDYLDLPYPSTVMLNPRVHDGASVRGVLLYGINSSGKSSLMKSIGIAVVLAQAGFYVPAAAMKFSLFEGVFTRIMSRDNVAKSLSTFGVEMLELNTIFKHASAKTLVLGDEISHGTETLSAVAIVASTVMELARSGGLFVVTTHLHQLSQVKELSSLREVVSLHLSVRYDETLDRLVYDRTLQPGRGSSIYGLEFAQSLHMDGRFLANAHRLRETLAKEYEVLELGHQKEYIRRYREVVACECVICGALVRRDTRLSRPGEHHHLIAVCDAHARQIAEGKIKLRGFIMTPQGLRLEYETQL